MTIETTKTYCRYCHAYCAIEVDIEDGKPVAIRGDSADPVYGGYTCIKGRQLPDVYAAADRITAPLKRQPDGSFKKITMQQAMDEIAGKVGAIVKANGPRAVASYNGTYAFMESAALAVSRGWHQGIGSDSYYTSVTLDQPGRPIAMSRFGMWNGGTHAFSQSDVVLEIGNNPVVSQFSVFGGIPPFNPARRMNDALNRGVKLIVIDPRETEIARKATLFLQPRPGEDPTLLAGFIRLILDEELHDREFCDRFIEGLDDLRDAVDDYTLDYVSKRTDVPEHLIAEAARMFAAGPRGVAVTGTGPNMSPHAALTEHFVLALNTICGRVNREGEKVPNPGVLNAAVPRKAEVMPAAPAWGHGPRNRVRNLGQVFGEMPTAALSDEILMEGKGQVKALLSIGGNPIVAWPDQIKTKRALDALDLLVCIDIKMSATAKLADYVLPGKMCLEREDTLTLTDTWYDGPYGHYTKAVAEPNGDLIEEWEFYWELAHRMGTEILLPGGNLPTDEKPAKLTVLEHIWPNPKVPLAEMRETDGGRLYEDIEIIVQPGDGTARLQVAPTDVVEEIRGIRAEPLTDAGLPARDGDFSHLLISRRLKHVYNSSGQNLPDIRRGVISMAHAWGDLPGNDGAVREIGSSTNRLLSNEEEYDPITGMARQSAIPVNVRATQLEAAE